MVNVKDILQALWDCTESLGIKRFISERPKATSDSMNSFLVISITSSIQNKEIGQRGSYNMYEMYVSLDLFVRSKQSSKNYNSPNMGNIETKLNALLDLFPIVEPNVMTCTNPTIVWRGDDDRGFHCISVLANVRTF